MWKGCLPQNINYISPTPKPLFGITQIITYAYQVCSTANVLNIKSLISIKINLFAQISMLDLFTQPKNTRVYIRFSLFVWCLTNASTLVGH